MKLLVTFFLLAVAISTYAQKGGVSARPDATNKLATLKATWLLREKAKAFLQDKKYDSAATYFSKVTADAVHANATDYLNLSLCHLQLDDTAAFKRELVYSIEYGGADSAIVHMYLRPVDSTRRAFFVKSFSAVFPGHRSRFLKTIDSQLVKEMKDIQYFDQIARRAEDQAYVGELYRTHDTSNPNLKHLSAVYRYVDSVNYDRVVALIKAGKYPGYHDFGISSADLNVVLMHITDHNEAQWNFIFSFLKQQVLDGNMMPNELVAIATRHYQKNKCTYYGTQKWGLTIPCDCDQVDKFREEIGLDSLKQEYQRLKQQLPPCYHQ